MQYLNRTPAWLAACLAVTLMIGCGDIAKLPVAAGTGPTPQLPPPQQSLIPTVNIAPALRWSDGSKPTPAPGLQVNAYAGGLDHPRWLKVLPNGDVLVAETNKPPKPENSGTSLKGLVMKWVMKRAGAGVPSANRITLLRDVDGDGVAETRSVFLQGLNSPFGIELVDDTLYVANTDAVVSFPYRSGQTEISAPPTTLVKLPAGPRNHHWTKNILASRDGKKLYATVGSNSNVAEFGMAEEIGRAAIWEIDLATGQHRIFATGLRNPNGMAWAGDGGTLWTVVNERDEIGSDLVPDYLTSVQDGGFYGWPYSYFGDRVDTRVEPQRPELVARAVAPDYALGPHVAALGLAWAGETSLPERWRSGMFIGQHGSWNRRPHSGYDVVYVPFSGNRPSSAPPIEVLTGFLSEDGKARGRPVGVAIARDGALLVADDVGNVIWRVSAAR